MLRSNRVYTVLFNVCIWVVLFSCVLLWRPHNMGAREVKLTNWQIILAGLPMIAAFYLQTYWLIPAYLSGKRMGRYILFSLIVLLGICALSGWVYLIDPSPAVGGHYRLFLLRRMLPALFFTMAGASVGTFRENLRLEKNRKEKETEHLRTELSFLRAQVNPHFMLNVLNSMALLARKKSDLLEPVLMELAGLMNYMLYEANNEKIRLEEEVGYLKAYIDLQMLRFGDDVTVRFNTPDPGLTGNICIEPMLLIPLVENAFKHGIGLIDDPMIFIDIWTKENRLLMTVKNKYNPLIRQQENRPPGIGLKNLHKRLELIYPGNFELSPADNHHIDTVVMESWFAITLNIPAQ
jgi:two-component system LytT family sensor kinase